MSKYVLLTLSQSETFQMTYIVSYDNMSVPGRAELVQMCTGLLFIFISFWLISFDL